MNPVESRALRYFVAVDEELNFTRAARRIGIAAPALSRAVAGLEADLGVRLFARTTRSVGLTEVGALLPALVALDAATLRARRAAGVTDGRLVLAVKADVEAGLLEDVLAAYAAEPAAVPVEVVFTGWREQPRLLRAGEADVAIVVEPLDTDGLDVEPLLREPQLLALPAGHPLAGSPRLRLADIEADHRPAVPGAYVYVRHGEQLPPFGDMVQMLRQIELGRMVALFPASVAARNARPQLTWRPVDDAPEAAFAVAWPQHSHSLAVAAFVRIATAVAADRPADIGALRSAGVTGPEQVRVVR
ncbi:LysR family transcriptional regulator [Micromonospora sp. HM134]|uniref:LysR family transcriptional regulator n=1 Tax=Micromonospora sp. HM134 TaxID=2583243 RepID=UPI001F0ED941|nr:LysR substrate-binding domain-containing protein [Micromonospora sp. HM134]